MSYQPLQRALSEERRQRAKLPLPVRLGVWATLASIVCAESLAPAYAADRATTTSGTTAAVRIASWDLHDLWHRAGEPLRSGSVSRGAADYQALRDQARSLRADVIALQGIGSPRAARRLFPSSKYYVVFSRELAIRQQRDRDMLSNPARRRVYNAIVVRRAARLRVLAREHILETADPSPGLGVGRPQGQSAVAVKLRINKQPVWIVASRLVGGCDEVAKAIDPDPAISANGKKDARLKPSCAALRDQVGVLNAWKSLKTAKKENVVAAVALPVASAVKSHGNWARFTHADPKEVASTYRKKRQAATRRERGLKRRFVLTNPIRSDVGKSGALQPRTVALIGPSRRPGERLVPVPAGSPDSSGNLIVDALKSLAQAARKSASAPSTKSGAKVGVPTSSAPTSDSLTGQETLAARSVAGLKKLAPGKSSVKRAPPASPKGKHYVVRYPEQVRESGCRERQAGANYLLVDRRFYEAAKGAQFGAAFKSEGTPDDKARRTDCAVFLDIPRL